MNQRTKDELLLNLDNLWIELLSLTNKVSEIRGEIYRIKAVKRPTKKR